MPKATRDDYAPRPFFYQQTNRSGGLRFVAWTGDVSQLEGIFVGLLQLLPPVVELLLKVSNDDDGDDPWERFHGLTRLDRLIDTLRTYRTFVYQDARHQLCVRDPEGRDYIVIDDAGVIYVYSSAAAFRAYLIEAGLQERQETLITELPHWRQEPTNRIELLAGFLKALDLTPIEKGGKTGGLPS